MFSTAETIALERMVREHTDVQAELVKLVAEYKPIKDTMRRNSVEGYSVRAQRLAIREIEERAAAIAEHRGWDVPCFVASIDAKAYNY